MSMTTTESTIVSAIQTEIATATGDVRSKLIDDLWTVLGSIEKRIALEAKGIVPKMESEVKTLFVAAEKEGGQILGKIKAEV